MDAKNDGTIDAMIDVINKTATIPNYLNYTVTYGDGEEILTKHLLSANSFETYKVRVEYRTDINPNDLPSTAQSISLSFGVNYVQADSNAVIAHKMVYLANDYPINLGDAWDPEIIYYDNPTGAQSQLQEELSTDVLYLKSLIKNGIVDEIYGVFVITNEMAQANNLLTPGVYSLRGGGGFWDGNDWIDSIYYETNKSILLSAFDESLCGITAACTDDSCTDSYEWGYFCRVDDLIDIQINKTGEVIMYDESVAGLLPSCVIVMRNESYHMNCVNAAD